jgi:hypothetical protein
MVLIAEMCDHKEWSKKNAEGVPRRREKARPMLSTGHCHINRFYWSVPAPWQEPVSIKSMG